MNIAIILSGGSGTRFGTETPKQYININNKAIVQYSIEAFEKSKLIDIIIIVVSDKYKKEIEKKNPDHIVVVGGKSRVESSYEGIMVAPKESKKILIHDAARPFVSQKIITSCINELDKYKAVVTSISATDTIIKANHDDEVDSIQNREELYLNQTPQGFDYQTILQAHQNKRIDVTDDISLINLNQIKCKIISGSHRNIKITTPQDIHTAKSILDL